MNHVPTAAVGMSGGVDSSVAALLFHEAGYLVTGVTLQLHRETHSSAAEASCGSDANARDARAVCDRLGIDFQVWNMEEAFRRQVMDRFAKSYASAQTPNPCIFCNRHIKFGAMLETALSRGIDYVATGHYANVSYHEPSGRYRLTRAKDLSKDQSYVLYSLTQHQLAHLQFPLGNLEKSEVRAIAEQHGFGNAHKQESQDICFVPDGDYAGFIQRYCGISFPAGDFVDRSGRILGQHKGIIHYTVGQRKGLGLSFPQPMYVLEKNLAANQIVLGPVEELFQTTLLATDINLISVPKIEGEMAISARIRYNQKEQPANVVQVDDNTLRVTFLSPQKAIAKGQAVVLYDGDVVVGGGTIV